MDGAIPTTATNTVGLELDSILEALPIIISRDDRIIITQQFIQVLQKGVMEEVI